MSRAIICDCDCHDESEPQVIHESPTVVGGKDICAWCLEYCYVPRVLPPRNPLVAVAYDDLMQQQLRALAESISYAPPPGRPGAKVTFRKQP